MAWLALLGAVFVLGYSSTNARAALLPTVARLGGPWDAWLPFWPWTLLPYLSLNLIYPCALLAQPTRAALDRLALRLAAVQLACLAVFWLWPTGATRQPPALTGPWGLLYAQLRAFEQPFNLFPSLHVAVLVLAWHALTPALPAVARWAWHGWCVLILVSTLTTWQHDLIDVAGGLAVGLVALAWRPPRIKRCLSGVG